MPCRYGASRLTFRGPARVVVGGHVAALGGSETFGANVALPWPELLERRIGVPVVNLGAAHAGIDALAADEAVLAIARTARLVVVQITGAHLLSNGLYSLHARRNDRVIRQTDALRRLYPRTDFSGHVFVRHMLKALHAESPRRFSAVRDELQSLWPARMLALCAALGRPAVLLWMGSRPPDDGGDAVEGDPLFVTRAMLDTVRRGTAGLAEVWDDPFGRRDLRGQVHADGTTRARNALPGADLHDRAADALAGVVAPILAREDAMGVQRAG
ncbi:hypothetical protein OCGS_0688 [Oceaniovalibus guishaninsula JLT2003]|uniref:DUF6473 domain-containing protein n=1 Tax=Oceaniovalibus guishaninsula JLT2003 TaxID=1231392 RepID=K2I859_9RHOB|nr:hypothetical protein OCGS_0688 [Oceaniovalibus guishaninsula JLT2003]